MERHKIQKKRGKERYRKIKRDSGLAPAIVLFSRLTSVRGNIERKFEKGF